MLQLIQLLRARIANNPTRYLQEENACRQDKWELVPQKCSSLFLEDKKFSYVVFAKKGK